MAAQPWLFAGFLVLATRCCGIRRVRRRPADSRACCGSRPEAERRMLWLDGALRRVARGPGHARRRLPASWPEGHHTARCASGGGILGGDCAADRRADTSELRDLRRNARSRAGVLRAQRRRDTARSWSLITQRLASAIKSITDVIMNPLLALITRACARGFLAGIARCNALLAPLVSLNICSRCRSAHRRSALIMAGALEHAHLRTGLEFR